MNISIQAADARDAEELAQLVNSAYRGESSKAGWTTEAELIGGQRTDPHTLREEISRFTILCLRTEEAGPIRACVSLEDRGAGVCYLGMLTVAPTEQSSGLGRAMLDHAESHARSMGFTCMEMTVIPLREALIAWYERRGYSPTGETRPFPYGDPKRGDPKVEGLYFVVLRKNLG